ncbi:MAG TPA: nucleotidyl transferase AbiEii/AbiGii toxin family protein, partial [Bacteroidia bacterium]
MENKIINTKIVAEIAIALDELREKMVFVGGAVISLYTDDPAADEIRPTGDIDLTVQLTGFGEWTKLNERLLELGFAPNPNGKSICNYLFHGIEVDIMPSDNSPIG